MLHHCTCWCMVAGCHHGLFNWGMPQHNVTSGLGGPALVAYVGLGLRLGVLDQRHWMRCTARCSWAAFAGPKCFVLFKLLGLHVSWQYAVPGPWPIEQLPLSLSSMSALLHVRCAAADAFLAPLAPPSRSRWLTSTAGHSITVWRELDIGLAIWPVVYLASVLLACVALSSVIYTMHETDVVSVT
jgi:hypothetical protein